MKFTHILSIAGASLLLLPGAVLAIDIYEGFDYPAGLPTPDPTPSVLANGAGGYGWNTVAKPNVPGDPSPTTRDEAAWGAYPNNQNWGTPVNHQGVGGSSIQEIIAPTLVAPANYGFTPTGNELFGEPFAFASSYREFDPSFYINMDSGSTVYFSMLISQDNIEAVGASYTLVRFIGGDPEATDAFRAGIGIGLDKTVITDAANTPIVTGTDTMLAATSYLMIGKIVPGGASSTVSFDFVREDELIPATESWDISTAIDLSGVVIDRIGLLSGGAEGTDTSYSQVRRSHFDEIRFGDTYLAVTGLTASVVAPEGVDVAIVGNDVQLTFDAVVGQSYQILVSTDDMASFSPIGSPTPYSGASMTLTHVNGKPTVGSRVFYRIEATTAP